MTRDDVVRRVGELSQRGVAFERLGHAVGDRKHAPFVDVRVQVRRIGRQHDVPARVLTRTHCSPFECPPMWCTVMPGASVSAPS